MLRKVLFLVGILVSNLPAQITSYGRSYDNPLKVLGQARLGWDIRFHAGGMWKPFRGPAKGLFVFGSIGRLEQKLCHNVVVLRLVPAAYKAESLEFVYRIPNDPKLLGLSLHAQHFYVSRRGSCNFIYGSNGIEIRFQR